MSDEYRGESHDGESGVLLWALVILLLLMGAGAGTYFLIGQRTFDPMVGYRNACGS
jgi:hypothetical protein